MNGAPRRDADSKKQNTRHVSSLGPRTQRGSYEEERRGATVVPETNERIHTLVHGGSPSRQHILSDSLAANRPLDRNSPSLPPVTLPGDYEHQSERQSSYCIGHELEHRDVTDAVVTRWYQH